MPLSLQLLMPPKPGANLQALRVARGIEEGAQFQERLAEAQKKLLAEVLD